jgi:hypothetical protein
LAKNALDEKAEEDNEKGASSPEAQGDKNKVLQQKAETIAALDKKKVGNVLIDSQSINSDSMRSHRNDSHRGMLDQQ